MKQPVKLINRRLGLRLTHLRKSNLLERDDVSESILKTTGLKDFTPNYIARLERGVNKIGVEHLMIFAHVYGVELASLLDVGLRLSEAIEDLS
jgi:transcriptional regulator with XRE-family HTH domain